MRENKNLLSLSAIVTEVQKVLTSGSTFVSYLLSRWPPNFRNSRWFYFHWEATHSLRFVPTLGLVLPVSFSNLCKASSNVIISISILCLLACLSVSQMPQPLKSTVMLHCPKVLRLGLGSRCSWNPTTPYPYNCISKGQYKLYKERS